MVVDAREGIMPLDKAVAEKLRHRAEAPAGAAAVILVANKADDDATETAAGQFAALGFGPPLAISAIHRRGIDRLLEEIARRVDATAPARMSP